MVSFSIIICTYNPQKENIQRLLQAIQQFDISSALHEVILVDNNSLPAMKDNDAVQQFLLENKDAKLITELKPGLTSARIAGIEQARYSWVVFFDDDNEPASDYLIKAAAAIEQYQQVGAWGPGTIEVEYTEDASQWLETRKELFQQRHEDKTTFQFDQHWQNCYPFGTGLIIQKAIAEEYVARVKAGCYTLSDRKGKSLASGGDVQMVLTGIEMGYAAGVIQKLSLKHLIDSSKTTLTYLRKQQYGTASAYVKAYNQVFQNNKIEPGNVTNYSIVKSIYAFWRIHRSRLSKNDFKLSIASKLGEMNAAISALEKPKPILLQIYEKLINA